MSAKPYLPRRYTLESLREAAQKCHGCELYKRATQTVFGEGARQASVMLIGEIPGNQEDLKGHPFVGPAGRILAQAIDEAALSRGDLYITNAVKHFKWISSGKRRLHTRPSSKEISACRPWLEAELELIKPIVVVCLGATAALSMTGRRVLIQENRGKWIDSPLTARCMITIHPSAILRFPERWQKHATYNLLVTDFKLVRKEIASPDILRVESPKKKEAA